MEWLFPVQGTRHARMWRVGDVPAFPDGWRYHELNSLFWLRVCCVSMSYADMTITGATLFTEDAAGTEWIALHRDLIPWVDQGWHQ